MRAVNTENEKILKEYKSEGRIMQDQRIQTDLMAIALLQAKNNKSTFMNPAFKFDNSEKPDSTDGGAIGQQPPRKRTERVMTT